VLDNPLMRIADVSDTERAVLDAFGTGALVDVRGRPDPVVRAEVIRFLLLGGAAIEAGTLPAIQLTGAHITGALEVEHADITAPISLFECRFDEPISFFGSRLRRLNLHGSTMPELMAANITVNASLGLARCRSSGVVIVGNTRINGSLILDGAQLSGLSSISLRVSSDVLARDGFTCRGQVRLDSAEIAGSLRFEGASLDNPGGTALSVLDGRVGANAHLCEGFTANGAVELGSATVTSRLCLEGATLAGTTGTALGCRHLTTRELVLLPTRAPDGVIDLSHARLGLLRDDPATWPPALHLDGLTYEALSVPDHRADRLRWLRLDPHGFRPQAYTQLAQVYRSAGRDDDARTVLLAGERDRLNTLAWPGRLWGHLQDLTVGFGYRPVRAAAWLVALLVLGTTVFGLYPPRPADPGTEPEFVPFIYTLDLVLPLVDFGQQSAFHPRGATIWLAYALIVAGLLFVTTIAAAGARRLRRT
jgi:hypothetical protein